MILEEDALPPNVFAKNFLPSVLALSSDPVPNVRLSLSKVMAQRIMPLGKNPPQLRSISNTGLSGKLLAAKFMQEKLLQMLFSL